MSEAELREIEERLKAASTHRGKPWIATSGDDWAENWLVAACGASGQGEGKNWYVTTDRIRASEFSGDSEDDAKFIANAPADIWALLNEVRRLRKVVDEIDRAVGGVILPAASLSGPGIPLGALRELRKQEDRLVESFTECTGEPEGAFIRCDRSNPVVCPVHDYESWRIRRG